MEEIQLSAVAHAQAALSPSLASDAGDAYELKFRLSVREAEGAEAWARQRLTPDPHGDGGTYQTTSLYLDTPFMDIYHKSPGYRRNKYRLRRYRADERIHLERKTRRGDRVHKRREVISLAGIPRLLDLDGGGVWFGSQVRQRLLRPICWIGYARTAFGTVGPTGPLRLTLDREVVGMTASGWDVPAAVEGRRLMPDEVILELKFRLSLPALFHELLGTLPSRLAGVSKYGRCVEAWDLARESV